MHPEFHVIIPARYQSSRLPGKLLMEIDGLSVLERVYRQAAKANPLSVIIATDSTAIADHAVAFGAKVAWTSEHHESGTDRIAEVVRQNDYSADAIIVNVQGDEPFIHPQLIIQVANSLNLSKASMATLCWPIEDKALYHNPNVVKVVRNQYNQALYFSRSPIPAQRDATQKTPISFRHIGLYAYRASFLQDYHHLPACSLEQAEMLEQLRVLWAGYQIQVEQACILPLQDINTIEDLDLARHLVEKAQVS